MWRAVVVGGAVAGHGGDPGAEGARIAKAAGARHGGEEYVLHQIVHLVARRPGQQDAMDHRREILVKASERGAIAVLGGEDEVLVHLNGDAFRLGSWHEG